MLKLIGLAPQEGSPPCDTLTLPYSERCKSRLRTRSDNGLELGLFLPPGSILRDGDLLRGEDGRLILVRAASEPLSQASCADPWLLARACYHLGNRHVAVQIGCNNVCYLTDRVLDELMIGLGLQVTHLEGPFEPESGAYAH